MRGLKVLAILLCYPEPEWVSELDQLQEALTTEDSRMASVVAPWFDAARDCDLPTLQDLYVSTFHNTPSNSLELLARAESRRKDRGSELARIVERYRTIGFEIDAAGLPDYLPMYLEYLALLSARRQIIELRPLLPAIVALKNGLAQTGSPYVHIMAALEEFATRNRRPGNGKPTSASLPARMWARLTSMLQP